MPVRWSAQRSCWLHHLVGDARPLKVGLRKVPHKWLNLAGHHLRGHAICIRPSCAAKELPL